MRRIILSILSLAIVVLSACARREPTIAEAKQIQRERLTFVGDTNRLVGATTELAVALCGAQLLIQFLREEYNGPRIQEYLEVEASFDDTKLGKEWQFTFHGGTARDGNRVQYAPGYYFDIWVDDNTGRGVDYSPGE